MKKRAFTLVELLVVISIIAMLLAVLMPSLGKARELAKRTICMSNQKQLVSAWTAYSTANNDQLVPGYTTRAKEDGGIIKWAFSTWHPAKSWVPCPQNASGSEDSLDPDLPDFAYEQDKINEMIKLGLLYEYAKDVKAYGCPSRGPEAYQSVSYAINEYLNGYCQGGVANATGEYKARQSLIVKKAAAIKRPSEKMAFICQGGQLLKNQSAEGFGVTCQDNWNWVDVAPVAHMKKTGTDLSFADGHAEYWTWKGYEDYQASWASEGRALSWTSVQTAGSGDPEDYLRLKWACWGKRPSNVGGGNVISD